MYVHVAAYLNFKFLTLFSQKSYDGFIYDFEHTFFFPFSRLGLIATAFGPSPRKE